jgi:DNA-binding PadR family transcriptional regulator
MAKGDHLGELEQIVMLAVAQCGKGAHGAAIHAEIVKATGRDVSLASVYATLGRLEKKRLLGASAALGGAERGGRPRKEFRVTAAGIRELRSSRVSLDRLWRGLSFDPIGRSR